MKEKDYYPVIKNKLEEFLRTKEKTFHLDITANKNFLIN